MPNQAAASFFFGFFRFFAVLFGLAVFKFFSSCCCGETAGGDFTLNPVLSPEIWFCCLRCFFFVAVAVAAAVIQFICLSAECVLGSV